MKLVEQPPVKLLPEDIRRARSELLSYILGELNKVENFWRFIYRKLVSQGIGISCDAATDVGVIEDGIAIAWTVRVVIPEELWKQLAALKKRGAFKWPKPHHKTKRRVREAEYTAREELEHFNTEVEEGDMVSEIGEEDNLGVE